MSAPRLPLLLLLLALGGCAVLEDKLGQAVGDGAPPTADEALAAARELSAQGRWTDAIALLGRAAVEHPEDERLAQAYVDLRARGDREVRVIRDEIMVGDAENQQAKIALLERLSNAEPDDLIVMSRRLYWNESLAATVADLTDCAEFHVTDNPALARRCFEAASQIPAMPAVEQRLAQVEARLIENENAAAAQRRASAEKARQTQAKALLDEAREAIGGHRYRRALDILKRAAKLEPENPELAELQQQALEMLSPQVDALVKLGDHLYLEERLEAAVGTWQAALTLNPDDEEIVARIERAKTVLKKLETLRSQQNGEGKVPSPEASNQPAEQPGPDPSPDPSPVASDPPLATPPPP
jgi:tetratricopeptide (TPR) repeat protein